MNTLAGIPKLQRPKLNRIVLAAILSLLAYGVVQLWSLDGSVQYSDPMVRAEKIMDDVLSAVKAHRRITGAEINPNIDPNGTDLIGPQDSPLMTSLGQLEAKRSTTNPEMAGLIERLLEEAGVRPGDSVAIGSSGSFPALLIASLAACKAMDAHPVTILSLGASSYGATRVDFDLLDIYLVLMHSGIGIDPPAAVSLGGDKDAGLNFDPQFRDRLIRKIKNQGMPLLLEPELSRNVAQRMEIYRRNAGGRIAAFINSGGGYANLGASELVLRLSPGLNKDMPLPPNEQRGVMYEMAARGIPVIHLLYIKGLTQKFGLPWDPVPLPHAGAAAGHAEQARLPVQFWLVCAAYFGLLILVAFHGRIRVLK